VSSDQAPGAPYFGDLFDDPDAPVAPVVTPAAADAPAESHVEASMPEAPAPVVDETPDPEPAADVAFSSPYTEGATDLDVAVDEPLPEEPPAPSYAAPAAAAAAAAPAPAPWDGTVDPAASSSAASPVNTGRLYRSAGAEGPATLDAIPAIDPSYVPRAAAVADHVPSSTVTPPVAQGGGRGLTYSGVAVVVISVTVLVAFADALIHDKLGISTGVALAVSSIYAAVTVRRADIWAAVVMPPIAFLVAALTAGQLTLDSSGSLLIREAYMLFRTLAVNAPWILGTTVVCLVIVLVRRARS
jgi:hypothetical protein